MSDMDDKTRIKPSGASGADTGDAHPATADDKTRFAPRPQPVSNPPGNGDRTRVQSPRLQAGRAAPDGGDKTRFAAPAKSRSDDKTRLQPISKAAPTDNSASSGPAAESGDHPVLKNRFVFEEVLGAGGMGIVYKARDLLKVEAQDRDPYVAIKVLSDEFKAHPEAFIALQRESRKTQRIAHPNIVNVYDFDRDGDTVFMTMEYMDGMPLDKLISQYRSVGLPTESILQILEGISAALIYAHDQNIIHSDFKPGNIFVTSNGTAKVFDFGIARAVAKVENREESKDDRTVFDAGNLGALTPAYASLEMLEGATPDVRDDVYALGCIAYELFTGEHPFNRMHADEARRRQVKPKRIAGISKNQWRAIEHALAFQRDDRSESVEAFWNEFTRKQTHTGKIAVAIVVIIGLAGGAFYQYGPQRQPQFSELQFRSEIERNLRIELKKESLATLHAAAEFTPAWEATVWNDVQELRHLLGQEDEWLAGQESSFYALYLKEIESLVDAAQLSKAESLAENARRYTAQAKEIEELEARIAQIRLEQKQLKTQEEQRRIALAEERRRAAEKAEVVAKQNSEFDAALANVDQQLQCHGAIDMNDFSIAITKLRSVSGERYAVEEPRITRTLARCIEHVGSSFPERGEDAKRDAMRLFERNATIAGITIVPKDPCGSSLAGMGARGRGATCTDKSKDLHNPPVLVVIPGKGSIKTFAIGQFEVTVDEINEFCAASESCPVNETVDLSLPAHDIPLTTANAYLKWLSDKSGRRYRLPTRVEWQHAANAEGSRLDSNRNCRLNSRGISKGNALIKASIGQKNGWGLVNHLGNAREWVTERGGRHSAVGGSFETAMDECNLQSSTPHDGAPDPITGFRVLREVDA
jgi:serine/threonine protein kinase